MPAVSVAQQQAMPIAKHHPSKLFARNKGLIKIGKKKLGHFARTKHKGLVKRKKRRLIH